MTQFKRVILLFKKFEILLRRMWCLDEKIKKKLKLENYKKVFQMIKVVKFEIHSKKKKIEIFKL